MTRRWAASPDAAVGYLAARTRRGRRGDPGLAPSSLRRRAAALKGFYRFAYGEGLIPIDIAAHLDLPRPSRLLPETLTPDETVRLLEAAGGDDPEPRWPERRPRPARPRPARAALRGGPADQRGDRARPRGPVGRRRVRPRHRQGRQGAAGPGRRRRARLARPLDDGAAGRPAGARSRRADPRRAAVPRRSRRPAGAPAGVVRGQAGRRRGGARATVSARTRCVTRSRRTCSRAGPTCASSRSCSGMRVSPRRSCTRISPVNGSGRSTPGPSAGLRGRHRPHELCRRVDVDGRTDPVPHQAASGDLRLRRPLRDPGPDHRHPPPVAGQPGWTRTA